MENMKLAIPICGQDIALVFDDADCLLIVEAGNDGMHKEERLRCAGDTMIDRANQLRSLSVDLLICGAISCTLQRMIEISGIKIIPFVRGNAAEVFEAYCRDRLREKRHFLPGRHVMADGCICRGLKGRCSNKVGKKS
jgi:predicted Fe-Mo cluster-binding NifX family protein